MIMPEYLSLPQLAHSESVGLEPTHERTMTQGIRILLAAGSFLVIVALLPAKAEIGPCLPDQYGGLLFGEGAGGARVIDGTISPSKHLAFAWRSPGRPPTEGPDNDAVERLLIRVSDGA